MPRVGTNWPGTNVDGLPGYDGEFVALDEALGTVVVTDVRRVLTARPHRAVALDDFGAGRVPDASGQ